MLIVGTPIVQDKDSSNIALMTIQMEEILITESEIVKLDSDQLEGNTKEQATSAEKKGRQEPVIPSDTTNKSVLKSVIDWVG